MEMLPLPHVSRWNALRAGHPIKSNSGRCAPHGRVAGAKDVPPHNIKAKTHAKASLYKIAHRGPISGQPGNRTPGDLALRWLHTHKPVFEILETLIVLGGAVRHIGTHGRDE
jgi:hypothetical protein